jgi:hypothetical protein
MAKERIALAAEARAESPIAAMLSPGALSEALVATRQEVRFEAKVPLDAAMSKEVANAVVISVDRLYRTYRQGRDTGQPDTTKILKCHEFVLAAWPQINDFIREGKVVVDIQPATLQYQKDGGAYSYSKEYAKGDFAFTTRVDRWVVTFLFDTRKMPEMRELYEATFEEHEK